MHIGYCGGCRDDEICHGGWEGNDNLLNYWQSMREKGSNDDRLKR